MAFIHVPLKTRRPLYRGHEHLLYRGNTDMGPASLFLLAQTDGQEKMYVPATRTLVSSAFTPSDAVVKHTALGVGAHNKTTTNTTFYGTGVEINWDKNTAFAMVSDVSSGNPSFRYLNGNTYNNTQKIGYSSPGVGHAGNNASTLATPVGESGVMGWGLTMGLSGTGDGHVAFNGRTGSLAGMTAKTWTDGGPLYTDACDYTRHYSVMFERRWPDVDVQWYTETPERLYNLLFGGKSTRTIFLPTSVPVATSLTTIPRSRKSGTRAPTRVRGIDWSNPLTEGLSFATAYSSGPRDYVGEQLPTDNGVRYQNAGGRNTRYRFVAADAAWFTYDSSLIRFGTGDFTIMSSAYWDQTIDGTYSAMCGIGDTTVGEWMLGLTGYHFRFYGNGVSQGDGVSQLANGMADREWRTYVARRNSAFQDVVVFDQPNSGVGTFSAENTGARDYSSTKSLEVGTADSSALRYWGGGIERLYIWNGRRLDSAELRRLNENPWQIFNTGQRTIFLPAPPPVATSLTTIPRPRASQALAPKVIMGINHAHSFSRGIYDSWRVGEVTQRVSDGTTQGYTDGSGMSRYVSRVGVGSKRNGTNNKFGYVDLFTRDGQSLSHSNGYTIVVLMQLLGGSLYQGIVDDDDELAIRTLQFRVTPTEKVEAIVWRDSGAIDANFPTAATLTEGIHVVALRVIDSGEVSIWVDGVKDAATGTMLGSARPLFNNGNLRLFNRKNQVDGPLPSNSAMFGVHVYQEPISDSAIKGIGTPEGFWSVYNQGTRRIFLSGAAAAQEETPLTTSFRTIVRPVSRLSRIFLPTIIGDQSATPPSEETTFSRITMII